MSKHDTNASAPILIESDIVIRNKERIQKINEMTNRLKLIQKKYTKLYKNRKFKLQTTQTLKYLAYVTAIPINGVALIVSTLVPFTIPIAICTFFTTSSLEILDKKIHKDILKYKNIVNLIDTTSLNINLILKDAIEDGLVTEGEYQQIVGFVESLNKLIN